MDEQSVNDPNSRFFSHLIFLHLIFFRAVDECGMNNMNLNVNFERQLPSTNRRQLFAAFTDMLFEPAMGAVGANYIAGT